MQVPTLRWQERESTAGVSTAEQGSADLLIRTIRQRMQCLGWDSPTLLDSVFHAAQVLLVRPHNAGPGATLDASHSAHLIAVLQAVLEIRQLCLGVDHAKTGEAVNALWRALTQSVLSRASFSKTKLNILLDTFIQKSFFSDNENK